MRELANRRPLGDIVSDIHFDGEPVVTASTDEHQRIIDLIDGADAQLVLVSPFIHRDRDLQRAIARAIARDVRVQVICRPGQDNRLGPVADWCEVRHVERFHAKLYASETAALVGSLNLRAPGTTAAVEASRTVTRAQDETGYFDMLEAIQQVRDQGIRETEIIDETSLPAVHDLWRRGPTAYCVHCGRGMVHLDEHEAVTEEWMCIRCQAEAFANNVREYSHTSYCSSCGARCERPWSQFLCPKCYQASRASRPPRWHVEWVSGKLSVRLPASWTEAEAFGHPLEGVGRAVTARLPRMREATSVRATLRADEGGVSLVSGITSVLPPKSALWCGVRHLLVERSQRPPDPLSSGSRESRVQLDVVADDDVRGPDHWAGVQPLAAWEGVFKRAPDEVPGLNLAAIAKRPENPQQLEERTPLGLLLVATGPKDEVFDIVPWALVHLPWFVAAAHSMAACPKPDGVDDELWEQWMERMASPGTLGPGQLEAEGSRIIPGGVRIGELGLVSVHRVDSDVGPWKLAGKLVRLEARRAH